MSAPLHRAWGTVLPPYTGLGELMRRCCPLTRGGITDDFAETVKRQLKLEHSYSKVAER